MTPRNVPTKLTADRFLHVRMATDIPSTNRRYPQIMVTNIPLKDDPAPEATNIDDVPLHSRLGNFPYEFLARCRVRTVVQLGW